MKRLLLSILLATVTLLMASGASGHEMTLAEMQMREIAPGDFFWHWTASDKRPAGEDLTPSWPEACQPKPNLLRCGEAGLQGELAIQGVGKVYSAVLVKIFWLDGQSRVYTITAGQPKVHLYGAANDQRGLWQVASAYTVLGVEHILSGYDHQLFVLGLLFLVGFNRRLLWTISAFTLAHSVTLACSALGWLVLRSAPVEATIALSIVLVVGEALHQQKTLAKTYPALVAFLFGLVHGLGFAGALKEIGLPENHLLPALLTFNVGVEIGQLFTVSCAWFLWRLCSYWPKMAQARTPLLYAMGSVAAYWSWLRIVSIFGQH